MLHVMPDFMCDDISLRKVSGRTEAVLELLEEAGVQVHPLVTRTIEGSCGCLCKTARRIDRACKEHKFRWSVILTGLLEQLGPRIFCKCDYRRDEFFGF